MSQLPELEKNKGDQEKWVLEVNIKITSRVIYIIK